MRQISLFIFTCIALSAYGQPNSTSNTVSVDNGVEIPVVPCVEAYAKVLGKSVDPVAFCKCFIPRFYLVIKNDAQKLEFFKDGNWNGLRKDNQEIVFKDLQSCMSQTSTNDTTARFTITPRMAEGVKNRMKQELIGSDIERTNDVDKFCDCVIASLGTDFTIKEIMEPNFLETEKYQRTLEKCVKLTPKN